MGDEAVGAAATRWPEQVARLIAMSPPLTPDKVALLRRLARGTSTGSQRAA